MLNKNGSITLEWILIISAVVIIAVAVISNFNDAITSRNEKTINLINSTDTITNID